MNLKSQRGWVGGEGRNNARNARKDEFDKGKYVGCLLSFV